ENAGPESGSEAEQSSDADADGGGGEADADRCRCAVHHTCVEITARLISSEGVSDGRWLQCSERVNREWIARCEHSGHTHGDQGEDQHTNCWRDPPVWRPATLSVLRPNDFLLKL